MSNVSIYEKNWINLVFEDKNKAYGAYQLRQENPRTTLIAFFGGILLILSLIGAWMLFSSFGNKTDDGIISCPINPTITPIDLSDSPKKELLKPKTKQTSSQSPIELTNNSNMVVKATAFAVDNVPTNNNLPSNQNNTVGIGIGIDTPSNDSGSSTGTNLTPIVDNSPKGIGELDRLPEYPGTIKKFYEYVGNSIDKSEIENSSSSVSVIMSFVIEKDGTMTDIKVLRSNDKTLEIEAIRVLKALKIKWSPGYKDGEKVRTQYTLPIKVAI